MASDVDRGPLAGRCRECFCLVDTISDVCEAHEDDDKAHALRLLARQFSRLVVLDTPGCLVVTVAPVYGLPWVDIVLTPKPSRSFAFDESEIAPSFVTGHRVHLESYQIAWRQKRLWVYSHDWSYDHRLKTLLDAWQDYPSPGSHP